MLCSRGGISSGTCSLIFDAVVPQGLALARVVGEQAYGGHAEVVQHVRGDAVVAGVDRETEGEVRLDRVQALRLELHGLEFGEQTDSSALVAPEVEEDAAALRHNGAQRGRQLVAALAVRGAEGVSGQALRMQPGERVLRSVDIAVYQGHLFIPAFEVQIADGVEISVHGGQSEIHHTLDTRLNVAALGRALRPSTPLLSCHYSPASNLPLPR